MYICVCNAVTDSDVRECARNGATCVNDLTIQLGIAAGCGRCRQCAAELLEEAQGKVEGRLAPA